MPKVQKPHTHRDQTVEHIARQRLDDKEVESGLRAIYGEDEDVDFSKLEKRTWTLSKFLGKTVLVLGTLSVLTWAGYFAYMRFVPQPTSNDLIVTLDVPQTAQSGAQSDLVYSYQNPKHAPLANLSVHAQLPNTFVVESTDPAFTTDDTWNLGSVAGDANGKITIHGHWLAPVPSVQPVQFIATYKPGNFNAEFTLVKSAQVTLDKSIAELTVDGPENLAASESGTFTVKVHNTSTSDLPASTVSVLLPEGFFLEKTQPTFTTLLPPSWAIDKLPGGGETQFTFTGSFASGSGGFTPFTATLAFNKDSETIAQQTITHTVDVAAGDIRFDLTLNNSSGSTSVQPGETVTATIVIENTTNVRIADASLLMDFQSVGRMPIKWSGFDYKGGHLTKDGVVWDAKTIGTLEPGQKILLTPSFPILSTLGANDAKRIDIILHLVRGTGDLKSALYSVYIGDKATITGSLGPANDQNQYPLTIEFTPPPQPLEDILISFKLADGMQLAQAPSLPIGSGAFVSSTKEWKWRIPNIPGNSAPIKTTILLSNPKTEWNGPLVLRAIDPETLDELNISATITK